MKDKQEITLVKQYGERTGEPLTREEKLRLREENNDNNSNDGGDLTLNDNGDLTLTGGD